MLLWFVAAATLSVLFIFDSPAIDYRFVVIGATLPLVETISGHPWYLHTLIGSVGLLAAVMVSTVGKRVRRRRLLGIPIGSMVFLVASGVWTRTGLFWWPLGAGDGVGEGSPPQFDRPIVALVIMEIVGAAALVWLVRRYRLHEPERAAGFAATGRLPRDWSS